MPARRTLRLALSAFCLLALPAAKAQDAASPRVTRVVEVIRGIEGGVVAVFSGGRDGALHSGSGSVIHPAGFILTNDHVVQDRPGAVLLKDRPPVRYQLVGRLPEKDLAIIRIAVPEPLTAIPLGRCSDLMTGEPCLCGGNPGGRGIVFTSGIISSPAIMRDAPNALVMAHFASDVRDRFIQFDAASNPGNSGGPLVNAEGRQIGVVCARQLNEESISYAIPVDRLRAHAQELIAPEIARDLFAGLSLDPLAPEARVVGVAEGSPAARAGLEPGDTLVAVGDAELRDGLDWLLQLALHSAGDELTLAYRRADERKAATLKLDTYPARQPVPEDGAEPGLAWKLYADGRLTDFPDFDRLQPLARGVAPQLTTRELTGERKEHFGLRFEGLVRIETTGFQRLILASDDGSRLFLHGELLIDNGGPHPRQELGRKVRLEKGLHPIRIDYFEATGDSTLELYLEDPSGARTPLASGAFFHRGE